MPVPKPHTRNRESGFGGEDTAPHVGVAVELWHSKYCLPGNRVGNTPKVESPQVGFTGVNVPLLNPATLVISTFARTSSIHTVHVEDPAAAKCVTCTAALTVNRTLYESTPGGVGGAISADMDPGKTTAAGGPAREMVGSQCTLGDVLGTAKS